MSKYGVFSGPYFPLFGLNTVIYSVNLGIQSEYRNIRTKKNSLLDTFHAVSTEWIEMIKLKGRSMLFVKDGIITFPLDRYSFPVGFETFCIELNLRKKKWLLYL